MKNFKQGIFTPAHPEKYRGNVKNIVYRSSWEKKFLLWCDSRDSVITYSSEEVVVPYLYECDQKMHRYFVDFLIVQDVNGVRKTLLIEIKPQSQVDKPIPPKNKNRKALARYHEAIETYIKNQNKWVAATKYAKDRGWEFIVLTEKHLFRGKGKR